jgi:uncharacterized protein (TIGR02246 family)
VHLLISRNHFLAVSEKPVDVVNSLVDAINRGDIEVALNYYENNASMVQQPGQIVHGKNAVREAIASFIALKPVLRGTAYQVVESGDTALYCSRWSLVGSSPDGQRVEMSGTSADVLRRQPDGRWLIAIDNPWGTGIVAQ